MLCEYRSWALSLIHLMLYAILSSQRVAVWLGCHHSISWPISVSVNTLGFFLELASPLFLILARMHDSNGIARCCYRKLGHMLILTLRNVYFETFL